MARMFINKDSGALVRVDRVDASFAYITVLAKLPSTFAMPRREYDTTFIHLFRPAETGEIEAAEAELELPANAPASWRPAAPEPETPAACVRADDGTCLTHNSIWPEGDRCRVAQGNPSGALDVAEDAEDDAAVLAVHLRDPRA